MRHTSSVLVAATIGGILWVSAGDLSPPGGSIEPTMKTLTEVEPRTAIHVADLPLTISSPGSYYLAESITTLGGGITITSDEVTLDLMGFTLSGGTGSGISVPSSQKNITIKNGIVRGWAQSGILANQASNSHFQDLIVSNNGTTTNDRGLGAGDGCVVSNCTAVENAGDGFWLGNANIITDCVAMGNGRRGIIIASGTVRDCSARNNTSTGIISFSSGIVIEGCTATGSTTLDGIKAGAGSVVKNCSTAFNARHGINISHGEVRDCSCHDNGGDGIQAGFNATVIGNNCSDNDAAGINVAGRRSRIEGNNVSQNGTGIGGAGIRNLIIKNSAARNSPNYDIAADNAVGEIIDVTGSGGVPFTSGSPWANFVHEPALP